MSVELSDTWSGLHPGEDQMMKRVQAFYDSWKDEEGARNGLWGGANAVAILTGEISEEVQIWTSSAPSTYTSDETRYWKSSAFHRWLRGYVCSEMLLVFTRNKFRQKVFVLCSESQVGLSMMEWPMTLLKGAHVEVVKCVAQKVDDILREVRKEFVGEFVLGLLDQEEPKGEFGGQAKEILRMSGARIVDVSPALADLFAIKDEMELQKVRKAVQFTVTLMNRFVVPELTQAIFSELMDVTHSELARKTENVINGVCEHEVAYIADDEMDVAFPPVFMSGGRLDLDHAGSDEEALCYGSPGVVICELGVAHYDYCASVARTTLIHPNPVQKHVYRVLLRAHRAAVRALKPKNAMSAAYLAARGVVLKTAPELVDCMTPSAGWGMGLELRESQLTLDRGNRGLVRAGMVFYVRLGLQNLTTSKDSCEDPQTVRTYALLVGDTIFVGEEGPEVGTQPCSKLDYFYPVRRRTRTAR